VSNFLHEAVPALILTYNQSMMGSREKSFLLGFFLVSVLAAVPDAVHAQSIEIEPFGGWQAGGGFGTQEGTVDIEADVVYGVSVDVRIREDGFLEFIYSRQDTSFEVASEDPFDPFQTNKETVDASVEYYQGGGVFEFAVENRALRPFVVLTAGVARLQAGAGESEWWFSMGGGGGLKVFLSERWGIRFDARAWPTFLRGEGAFLCSLPGGCLIGFDTAASWQGSATVGVILAF
jgi:hypothetical protein